MKGTKLSLYAILAILLLACTISAQAGQLEVVPVLVEMQASAMSTTLTVFNHGKDKTTVQIRAFNWVQDVTGDVLSRSGIVLVSPPIAEIPGDSSQIFRILLRQPPTVTEAAYRIVLDELPSQQAFGTVQFSLRISLPMFAKPVAVTSAHLQWRAEPDGRDGAEIIATNHGTAAERVVGLGCHGRRGSEHSRYGTGGSVGPARRGAGAGTWRFSIRSIGAMQPRFS